MKYRIIYFLASALAIVLMTLFLPVIGGKPLVDWHSVQLPSLTRQEDVHTPRFTSEGPRERTIVYRWKEQDESWHFSQTIPEAGIRYETIVIDADQSHASLADPTLSNTEIVHNDVPPSPSLYSSAEIAQILQEAQKAQRLMQEHQEKLEATLSDTQSR